MNQNFDEHVQQQALSWYSLYLGEALTEEEITRLNDWLAEDVRHQYEYDMLADTYSLLDQVKNDSQFKKEYFRDEKTPIVNAFRKAGKWSLGLAASILIASILFFTDSSKQTIYASEIGQLESFILEDGTYIQLNSNTQLSVAESEENTLITLNEGQAFINTLAVENTTILMQLGGVVFSTLGSKLDLQVYSDNIAVTVIEGDITTENSTNLLRLNAGDMLTFHSNQVSPLISTVNLEKTQAWRDGLMHFDQLPIKDAISQYNRYAKEKIFVSSNVSEDILISGQFSTNDLDYFLDTLVGLAQLNLSRNNDILLLQPI